MKRVAAMLLALVMTASFASCTTVDPTPKPDASEQATTEAQQATGSQTPEHSGAPELPETPDDRTVFALNESSAWVKKLDPRMEATADGIVCDWSAAGVEFVATGKGDMTFSLSVTTNLGGGKEGCFFRAYVDGAAYLNGESAYYEVKKGDATITLKNLPEGTHTVRLVKVTGYTLANTTLRSVSFDGTVAETAPVAKNLLLEFVGDSICCGWGVIGDHKGAYSDQDATMAYPYLIAEAMGADLSVMALSGQGLTVGNPGILAGYKYASPNRSMKAEYGFARKADYSILNVGTNDAFQNLSAADFEAKLKELIAVVREKNGADCRIVLVGGMMKTEYNDTIKRVTRELGGAAEKYYVYIADQAAGGNHPTEAEHKEYAELLGGMLDAIEKGTYNEGEDDTPRLPTKVTAVWSQDFDSVTTPAEAGITQTITPTDKCKDKWAYEVRDGALSISKHPWHTNPDYYLTLVDAAKLAGAKTYLLEMDLTFTELAVFSLILNNDNALSPTDSNNNQVGAAVVSVRQNTGNGWGKGEITQPIVTNYIDFEPKQTEKSIRNPLLDADAAKTTFRLSILVESTEEGCRVSVFVNGKYSSGYTFDKAFNVTANSAVVLWAQDTSLTIDNLKLSIPA
ncbi:MAG: GDSL-type esterase/lipase family protein [Eubacteriales bacterium]|nr:GDSL-type esterase/lipase family protein [Eubacteriales bacterium]